MGGTPVTDAGAVPAVKTVREQRDSILEGITLALDAVIESVENEYPGMNPAQLHTIVEFSFQGGQSAVVHLEFDMSKDVASQIQDHKDAQAVIVEPTETDHDAATIPSIEAAAPVEADGACCAVHAGG